MKDIFPRTAKIQTLLGSTAVLIPVPSGQKRPVDKGWTDFTTEHLSDQNFLVRLESGNIGVLLGPKGGDLVTIDCDDASFRDAMLKENPWLTETLRTVGARGCNFWLRMKGRYPTRIQYLKDAAGNDLGEWRSGGSQTIISGLHPEGMEYRILVEKPPLEVELDQIILPPPCVTRLAASAHTTPHTPQRDGGTERRRNRGTEQPSDRATENESLSGVLFVDASPSLPTAPRQNHPRLFHLARAVKSDEKRIARAATREELGCVFDDWYSRNQFLRAEQTQADYRVEFMNAYENAHTGIGENPLPEAWQRACDEPVPPEILDRLRDENNELLCRVGALCFHLQRHVGDAFFILSCRDLGKHIQRDFKTANSYLIRLCSLGVIKLVVKGNKKWANRYRYVSAKKSRRKP